MTDSAAALGQFFTPRPVVDFACDALDLAGCRLADAAVIDPACGPGQWLLAALERAPDLALGCDCDPAMVEAWRGSELTGHRDCLLFVADALLPAALPEARFDVVVGNPPFGTSLADARDPVIRAIAASYHLWRGASAPREPGDDSTAADLRRLRRFPLELLFLERFVQLCRPGGWVAIVLPEGVAANARWLYVREWLLAALTVHAVVALPRSTFRRHHTTARTCLLIMHNQPPADGHQVALCEVPACTPEHFRELLDAWRVGEQLTTDVPDGLLPPPVMRL